MEWECGVLPDKSLCCAVAQVTVAVPSQAARHCVDNVLSLVGTDAPASQQRSCSISLSDP